MRPFLITIASVVLIFAAIAVNEVLGNPVLA
jgi:hypothetical protein